MSGTESGGVTAVILGEDIDASPLIDERPLQYFANNPADRWNRIEPEEVGRYPIGDIRSRYTVIELLDELNATDNAAAGTHDIKYWVKDHYSDRVYRNRPLGSTTQGHRQYKNQYGQLEFDSFADACRECKATNKTTVLSGGELHSDEFIKALPQYEATGYESEWGIVFLWKSWQGVRIYPSMGRIKARKPAPARTLTPAPNTIHLYGEFGRLEIRTIAIIRAEGNLHGCVKKFNTGNGYKEMCELMLGTSHLAIKLLGAKKFRLLCAPQIHQLASSWDKSKRHPKSTASIRELMDLVFKWDKLLGYKRVKPKTKAKSPKPKI